VPAGLHDASPILRIHKVWVPLRKN